jgi:DNA-directed RNA polymerase subunit RPC12/RpoP
MQLILDAVVARCPGCGHWDFRVPIKPLPPGSPLTCDKCGSRVFYSELADQARLQGDEPGLSAAVPRD